MFAVGCLESPTTSKHDPFLARFHRLNQVLDTWHLANTSPCECGKLLVSLVLLIFVSLLTYTYISPVTFHTMPTKGSEKEPGIALCPHTCPPTSKCNRLKPFAVAGHACRRHSVNSNLHANCTPACPANVGRADRVTERKPTYEDWTQMTDENRDMAKTNYRAVTPSNDESPTTPSNDSSPSTPEYTASPQMSQEDEEQVEDGVAEQTFDEIFDEVYDQIVRIPFPLAASRQSRPLTMFADESRSRSRRGKRGRG